MSRLDYCNAIYAGQPQIQLKRLQSVLNAAARLIHGASKFCHITPHLKSLHWLKMKERIHYKLGLLVFKTLRGTAPKYLMNLIAPATTSNRTSTLRSAASCRSRIEFPRRHINTVFGDRAFKVAAPTAWNGLPDELRNMELESSFRRKLKTHLFARSYT